MEKVFHSPVNAKRKAPAHHSQCHESMTGSASGAVLFGVAGTEARLEILYTHVGGIDVHKKQITVTARTPDPKRAAR